MKLKSGTISIPIVKGGLTFFQQIQYNITGDTEGVLKLPDLRKAAGTKQHGVK